MLEMLNVLPLPQPGVAHRDLLPRALGQLRTREPTPGRFGEPWVTYEKRCPDASTMDCKRPRSALDADTVDSTSLALLTVGDLEHEVWSYLTPQRIELMPRHAPDVTVGVAKASREEVQRARVEREYRAFEFVSRTWHAYAYARRRVVCATELCATELCDSAELFVGAKAVDDDALRSLSRRFPRLRAVDLSGCRVSSVGVRALVKALGPRLEAVIVSGRADVQPTAVGQFAAVGRPTAAASTRPPPDWPRRRRVPRRRSKPPSAASAPTSASAPR